MMYSRRHWPVYVLLAVSGSWYFTNLRGGFFVDEVIYVQTATAMLQGDPYLNPTHLLAPTAKYLMAVGLFLADGGVGARAVTAAFGVLTVYVVYRLGNLLYDRVVAVFAAIFVVGTYSFGIHAVRAMLDVPLTFFFLVSLWAALRWYHYRERWVLFAVGALAVATATTKAYGFLYAAPPSLFVVGCLVSEKGRKASSDLQYPVLGAFVVLVVLFVPYVFIRHPPVDDRFGPLVSTVLSIPVLGNFAYVGGAFVLRNFAHASGGHAVEVGSTVYQYPPVWSYVYWIFDQGGFVYLGAFVVTLLGGGYRAVRHRDPDARLLITSLLVPLGGLSLLTVKFPRYILPLLPLLALGGSCYARRFYDQVVSVAADANFVPRSAITVAGIFCLMLVVAAVTPPSPFLATATSPIQTDTQYDDVAGFVNNCADSTSDDLVVLTYSGSDLIQLEYYLGNRSDVRFLTFQLKDGFNDTRAAAFRRGLVAGEIDIVIRDTGSTVSSAFDRFVYERGTPELSLRQSPWGNRVIVYSFSNETCDHS